MRVDISHAQTTDCLRESQRKGMSMITINIHYLTTDELDPLSKHNYHRVTCECGHSLMVWPNTNFAPDDQVRCKVCASNVTYTLEWDKRKGQAKLVTRRPNESFDSETFFGLRKELTTAENLLNELADLCQCEGGQERIAMLRQWLLKMNGLILPLEIDMMDFLGHYKWLKERTNENA